MDEDGDQLTLAELLQADAARQRLPAGDAARPLALRPAGRGRPAGRAPGSAGPGT